MFQLLILRVGGALVRGWGMLRNKGWLPRRPVCNCGGDSEEKLGLDCWEIDGVFFNSFRRLLEFEIVFGLTNNLNGRLAMDHNFGGLADEVNRGPKGGRDNVENSPKGTTSAKLKGLLVGVLVAVKVKPSDTIGGGWDGEILVFVSLGVGVFGNDR